MVREIWWRLVKNAMFRGFKIRHLLASKVKVAQVRQSDHEMLAMPIGSKSITREF